MSGDSLFLGKCASLMCSETDCTLAAHDGKACVVQDNDGDWAAGTCKYSKAKCKD